MRNYPIFRLVIPLAAGIFFAETFRLAMGGWAIGLLALLLVGQGLLLKYSSFGGRWVFGAGVFGFMFLIGMMLTEAAWKRVKVDWSAEWCNYQGVLQDTPLEKPKSYQCLVGLGTKDVLLYLPKDSSSLALKVGDEVLFRARMVPPAIHYWYYKGVSGTTFVPMGNWKKMNGAQRMSLKQKALSVRERVMKKYRQWGVDERTFPVLSALTLGYKGDLDKKTREAYSMAGISHVLALSGMHIGFLWLLLNGLLGLLMKGRLRWLKWLLVVSVLWAFAFVVGLEASVVRAVIMCMLLELGRVSGGRPLSMNTLSIAAFFMLLYRPFYLFDVSFQLSFVAVASILYIYPVVSGSLDIKHRVGRWCWRVMSVSIAAQLGTAPLVMYYFSNFSVYFLLANLVASLVVPLIIYVSVLMLVISPLSCLRGMCVTLLDALVSVLNGMAEWTGSLPFASFSLRGLGWVEMIVCYVVLGLGLQLWKTGRKVWLFRMLLAFVCLLGLRLWSIWYG